MECFEGGSLMVNNWATQRRRSAGNLTGTTTAETAGRVGILGGLLWAAAIVLEYSRHLQPPAEGRLFYADQLMFAVALACWIVVILALRRAEVAGDGRSRHFLTAWATGYGLVVVGSMASLVARAFGSTSNAVYESNPLQPIGGLIAVVASLGAGVAIARAGLLEGWRRWVVVGYAVYVVGALFVPLFFGAEVDAVRETIWGLWWVAIGAALLFEGRPARR
jgi:hypothetical protein